MSGHGEKLTRKQEQAIAALLAEPTVAAAAKAAQVGAATLRRWLARPAFRAAYRAARRAVVEAAVGQLQRAAGEAVAALRRNLACGTPAAENGAAKAILEHSLKAVELLDLAERVEELERLLNEVCDNEATRPDQQTTDAGPRDGG
jgi:hypothetical protein